MNILKINLNTNSTYNDFKLKTKNFNKKIGFKGNNPGETIYPSCYNMSINQSSFLEEKIKNTLKYKKSGIDTIIDDLYAFAVKTPTMYRIFCFKDDVIFVIYIYQIWKHWGNDREEQEKIINEQDKKKEELKKEAQEKKNN